MPKALATSPTVSELLNASNWEYVQSGAPADLKPFLVSGKQLSFTSSTDGIAAHAWLTPKGQVVVSYEGTQFVSLDAVVADPKFSFQQVVEDTGVAQGLVTAGEKDAAQFARTVVAAAAKVGIGAQDVFLTGHSLGGIQAEYAAQQTGLGGVAFEATGLPRSTGAVGTGANFVNVVQDGDPVGNYSSDINAEQPFAPTYAAGGQGALPHYGYVATIGDPTAQTALKAEAALSMLGTVGFAATTLAYGADIAAYHLPGVQAHSLGVTLTQTAPSETLGVQSGPVLQAANDTIADLIAATGATLSTAMPANSAVSPTSGAYSGEAAIYLSALNGHGGVGHLDLSPFASGLHGYAFA